MDTFAEWALTCGVPCIEAHAKALIDLGVTWETFDRPPPDVIADLVGDGFKPRLVASDIVHAAATYRREELKKRADPLAIFWDAENVHIPPGMSGSDVVQALRARLDTIGTISQFRAYFSVSTNVINESKRGELQLSGVHIVDTPHNNRKEVADKMILVDAMEFAYENPNGATMAFVTADTDFAYLLSRLQRRPAWRTILITKGTMTSILDLNATMSMRWETDILHRTMPNAAIQRSGPVAATPSAARPVLADSLRRVGDWNVELDHAADMDDFVAQEETMTEQEVEEDDMNLVAHTVRRLATRCGRPDVLKADLGNELKQRNPARFPSRDEVKEIIRRAVDAKILQQTGSGATLRVSLLETPANVLPGDGITTSTKAPPLPDPMHQTVENAVIVIVQCLRQRSYLVAALGNVLKDQGFHDQNVRNAAVQLTLSRGIAQRIRNDAGHYVLMLSDGSLPPQAYPLINTTIDNVLSESRSSPARVAAAVAA
jgi:hypothetical protein